MRPNVVQLTYDPAPPEPRSWVAERPEIFRNKCYPMLTSAEKRYFHARPRIQKLMADLARKKEQLQHLVDIN